jgi:hypothetical protein
MASGVGGGMAVGAGSGALVGAGTGAVMDHNEEKDAVLP